MIICHAPEEVSLCELWRSLVRTFRASTGSVLGPNDRLALKARLRNAFINPRHSILSVEEASGALGLVWFEMRTSSNAFLLQIERAPAARGSGAGSALWAVFIREATASGARDIRLAVAGRNAKAMSFFLNKGCRVTDCEDRDDGRWYELTLDLDAPEAK